ncbi:BPI fold-containing family B member 2-like [Pelobates fuscus]|uniref:BPI fold-containing family B member 2-like n=1 Tax=Pelobates fuscus TaxID=191477 RepID=UPI002FE43D1A
MYKVICSAIVLCLVLQTHTTLPPCSGLLRYSEKAMEHIFQAQIFQLQDSLSNIAVTDVLPSATLDIKEINIQTADILQISTQLIPSFGVHVSVNADLNLTAKVVDEVVDMRVLAEIISKVQILQDFSGNPKLSIKSCNAQIKELQVTPETTRLEALKTQIAIILNQKLCLISSDVLLGLNVHLGEFNGFVNMGALIQIKYFLSSSPTVTSHQIEFGFNVDFYLLGKPLDISARRKCVPLPTLTSTGISEYSLLLPEDLFNAMFSAMEWAGAFNLDISGHQGEGTNKLTTGTLRSVNPEIPEIYPENLPIILKVGMNRTPRVTLHKDMFMLYLQPSVELMVMMPQDKPYESLLVVSMDAQMKISVKIKESKLATEYVLLNREVKLSLETSAFGSINLEELEKIIVPLLKDALAFHYKNALGVGWTMPNLFSLKILNPFLSINEGYAVVSGNLLIPV